MVIFEEQLHYREERWVSRLKEGVSHLRAAGELEAHGRVGEGEELHPAHGRRRGVLQQRRQARPADALDLQFYPMRLKVSNFWPD